MRKRHPKKEIEKAVDYAETCGWTVVLASGHAWGKLMCPWNDETCRCGVFCQMMIWSTPRVPEDVARKIQRAVDGCLRKRGEETGTGERPKKIEP